MRGQRRGCSGSQRSRHEIPPGHALRWSLNHRRLTIEPLEDRRLLAVLGVEGVDSPQNVDPGSAAGAAYCEPSAATCQDKATLIVSTAIDEDDGNHDPGDLSLREALRLAADQPDDDVIQFDGSLAGQTITLDEALGQLMVDSNVEIQGPGASQLTIDATGHSRVFYVESDVTATIDGLTITGGAPPNVDPQDDYEDAGGGICNNGTLTVTNSIITDNTATGHGGGIHNGDYGTLIVSNTTVSGNSAKSGGGVYIGRHAILTVADSSLTGNSAEYIGGGVCGKFQYNVVTLTNSTIAHNSAKYDGGGICNDARYSTWTVTNSTIADNSADDYGGGICDKGAESTWTVTETTIEGNSARYSGGGIMIRGTMALINSTVMGNSAREDDGGGICVHGYSQLTVTHSTISDNSAGRNGGGMRNNGTTAVTHSTISDNSAEVLGGGIHSDATLALTNSTVTGNSAAGTYGIGGGVYSRSGTMTLTNSTLAHNSANYRGGGIGGRISYFLGWLTITNSIAALNEAPSEPDFGFATAAIRPESNYNLIGVLGEGVTLGENTLSGTAEAPLDPMLATVRDAEGNVLYYRPQPGSPAVDGGSDALAVDPEGDPLATDVLGNPRIVGSSVDIGAVEMLPTPQLAVTLAPAVEVTEGQSVQVEVVLTLAPEASVLVSIDKRPGDSDDIASDLATLEFDGTNWDVAQVVTFSVVEDSDRNDDDSAVFTFSADGMVPVYLSVLARDDDIEKYVVDSLEDVVAADGYVTLREALEAANTNTAVGDAAAGSDNSFPDVITFAPELAGGRIVLSGTRLEILDDVEIHGLGAQALTIDAGGTSGVFYVDSGVAATMDALTLTGGSAYYGGAICSFGGTLTVSNANVIGNRAAGEYGGGICSTGTLAVSDSRVEANSARSEGGGIYSTGSAIITNSTVVDNSTDEECGGGIYNRGSMSVANSDISRNSANEGGGICNADTLTISNSSISANHSDDSGGGIYGRAGTAISVTGSSILGNSAGSNGGGICSTTSALIIANSTISGNTADHDAGGIGNYGSTLTITSSTLFANMAGRHGGGICSGEYGDTPSVVTITNTIVASNQAAASHPDFFFLAGSLAAESSHNLIGAWDEPTAPGANTVWGTSEVPLDPKLTAITDEAGTILYGRPHANSPAVDAGDNALAVDPAGDPLTTDVLDNPRIHGLAVDIGAVELSTEPQLAVAPTPALEMVEGDSLLIEVMLTAPPEQPVSVIVERLSGGSDDIAGDLTILDFDATNWNTATMVTISVAEDADLFNEAAVFTFSADGMDTVHLSVRALDNDSRTFVVDSLGDVVAADGVLTLREALEAANTNTAIGDAPEGSANFPDEITFAPELAGGRVLLSGAQLDILDDTEILGLGADQLTIHANRKSRVFYVDSEATATIDGLTITGGLAHDDDVYSRYNYGGGIYVAGTLTSAGELTLTNSTIVGNTASESGGGISNGGTLSIANLKILDNSASQYGGGIYNAGTLSIADSLIANNKVAVYLYVYGGGIYNDRSTATVTNSTIANNAAGDGSNVVGEGGGIYSKEGTLVITCSTVASNVAASGHDRGEGGGIHNYDGTLTLSNSIVALNEATSSDPDMAYTAPIAPSDYNLIGVWDKATPPGENSIWGTPETPLDPMLTAISDGSGTILYYKPQLLSPAINAGSNALAVDPEGAPLATDMLGNPRICGAAVDIGAVELPPTVAGRHVFYNNSAFDGYDPAAGEADDPAIAVDKVAFLPSMQGSSFANYTSYVRGINGIMVDLMNRPPLGGALDPADYFEFKLGNDDSPAGWEPLLVMPTMDVRPGYGVAGSDRVTLIWPDNTIQNQWLQVTVLANANSGLLDDDVFYFGNAIGEVGDAPMSHARVDAMDILQTRNNPRPFFDPAAIDCNYDFNRDQRVDGGDVLIVRNSQTTYFDELRFWRPSGMVVITEAATGTIDFVEIQNVFGSQVDTSGWLVAVSDVPGINNVDPTKWYLPDAMAAGEVLAQGEEDGSWGEDGIRWATRSPGWVMILDDLGNVADFVVWGYSESDIASIDVTIDQFEGITVTNAWNGPAVPAGGKLRNSLRRTGNSDHDDASDWAFIEPQSRGDQNDGLTVPFIEAGATGKRSLAVDRLMSDTVGDDSEVLPKVDGTSRQRSSRWTPSATRTDWLSQFEPMIAQNRPARNTKPSERAVDLLLATCQA